ncbi:MAG TPA: ribose-phosphate pyrophosphokinase [Firmicutes bacterium]|nr:ribose-phosphate pyrophosphokinase [Bacillota bacterium]
MRHNYKKLKIFTGNANPKLAHDIARYLGTTVGRCEVKRFRDGEINIRIMETVRGADVFVVQPTSAPTDTHLVELLIMIDAFRRASAKEIAAVIPYYGYARQDRKTQPRDPISAKLVANLLTAAGADRVLTMDLHAGQIQGFFDIPVDNLRALPILVNYFREKQLEDVVVVSPDVGGVSRAREFANRLNCGLAIVDKRRPEPNKAEAVNVIGEIEGKTAIIVDDIIDTAGSMVEAVRVLLDRGAKEVYACCSHPVLSPPAVERLAACPVKEVVVTDSIPLPPEKQLDKIKVLSVAPLFGEAIRRIFEELPVSKLFE